MTDAAASTVKLLSCPACGGTIELRAAGYSVSLICGHCRVTLDMTQAEPKLIAQASAALSVPWLPLGSRGRLGGIEWEVVGYMERGTSEMGWCEYLLFNPYHGYRFLVDDDRSWSFGQVLDAAPKHQLRRAILDGRHHEEFESAYRASVQFVVGEFYWRVAVGEAVIVRDFVRPGTMLSREQNDNEVTWTKLDILPYGAVEDSFGFQRRERPDLSFPSPHEPSPYGSRIRSAVIIAAIAIIAMLFASILAPDTDYLEASIDARFDWPPTIVTMGPIAIARHSGVGVEAQAAGLDNAWVDLDYSLVDRRTQESYEADGAAEYYSGVDTDGTRWAEGDSTARTRFSAVPPGVYDLIIEAQANYWGGPAYWGQPDNGQKSIPVRILVQRGAVFPENFWIGILLIIAWPLLLIVRHHGFESRRKHRKAFFE